MEKKLLVLSHSGGLDSSTLFLKAINEGYTVLPISYKYGQANVIENFAQQQIVKDYKARYPELVLDTIVIDFTSTIGQVIDTFKKNRDNGKMEEHNDMKYYMPSRNLLFMSTAAVIGEIIALDEGYNKISLGLGIHQHSDIYARDYWDISVEFASRLEELMSLNDSISVDIYAPYKNHYKSEIIKDSFKYEVPYQLTWTCYEPKINKGVIADEYIPCQECEACRERQSQAAEFDTEAAAEINNYHMILDHA